MHDPPSFALPSWPPTWPEIADSVQAVLESGDWGRYRCDAKAELIERLRQTFGVDHVWPTPSGTAAVEIALRAAGVGPGDRVALAAYDYPGNFRTIEILGARPVLVDIDPARISVCANSLRAVTNSIPAETIKAVIVSHLYGQPADIFAVQSICEEFGWVMIEDACQVPGMTIDGRPAGSFGDFGTLSFGGSKPLTCGNGGAVLTSSTKLDAKLASLLDRPSETYPISSLQAAALIPQLDRLSELVNHRTQIARDIARRVPDQVRHADHPRVEPSFYKLAFTSRPDHELLPIGPGFRSMHRSSERRCDKPVDLTNSQAFAGTCHVLDHRALMITELDVPAIVECLQ